MYSGDAGSDVFFAVLAWSCARGAGGYNPAQYIAPSGARDKIHRHLMTQAGSFIAHAFRLLVLGAALAMPGAAFADEFADVNQLLRSGKHAEALAKADQYIAGKPRDPQMRFLKGVVQTEAGRTADAIVTFTQLTEEYPELPEPYNNLAVLYAARSEFDKARVALESAVRANPGYAIAHENLGDIYAKLAAMSYGKAQQLDARNASVAPKLALVRQLFPATPRAR
jgi:tetratricopeptide (TPR) repeat protein